MLPDRFFDTIKPMKVGIDVSQVVYGSGVSDYTLNLVNNLPSEIIVPVGFSLRRQNVIRTQIPQTKIFPFPLSLMNYLWNDLHKVPFERFSGPIDIYHSSDWLQAPSSAKKITTIHDLVPFLYPQETTASIVATHTKKMAWVKKECDHCICVSKNTASDLMRVFSIPSKKITVIPEALPQRFMLNPLSSPYTNYIVAIGSSQPRKNINRLISAFLRYRAEKKFPQKLVIIGESQTLSSTDSIIFTGYVSDQVLVDIVAGAQALVYPSLYEGFGLPPLIAFHLGIPFVGANTSSLPEVVGEAGILVDPLSEISIAEGIAQALKDQKKLTTLGTKQLAKFSWELAAAQTQEVYNSLV